MTPTTQWLRVQELFQAAAERDAAERAAFLDEACGNDADLRAEVESLLQADGAAGDFLQNAPPADRPPASDETAARLIGKRIGRYHICSLIAAGGMGVVYQATQQTPRRTVALKVMRRGVASHSALRRFKYEAQVMGRLQHPGIAQIYEADIHNDDGETVPYFVMEYIPQARTIVEHVKDEKLSTRQRLELYVQACDAVHHGHQKGIIHRDLKPSNILVDAAGQVKVIDFGVARATDVDVAVTAPQTNVGQLIGTPQYMSPEQCDADPDDLDVRTDVYSLGVVLYELLTGEMPYLVSSRNVMQATRIVREQPPNRPSSINATLRGDVETIVLKALEKDRKDRYQSASDLGADLRRHLAGELITARPPTVLCQLRALARRHRAPFYAATAAVAALLLGISVTTVEWREAVAQEQQIRRVAETTAYGAKISFAEANLISGQVNVARSILETTDASLRGWEHRTLSNRLDRSLGTLLKANEPLAALDIDRTGQNLALAFGTSRAGHVQTWNIPQRRKILDQTWEGFDLSSMALSPDGKMLAIRSHPDFGPAKIRLWSLNESATPTEAAEWADNGKVKMVFDPEGQLLASVQADNSIALWDLRTLRQSGVRNPDGPILLAPHNDLVADAKFSPDGKVLASASHDRTVRLWRVQDAIENGNTKPAAVLCGHTFHVESVAFSPDGERLASASVDQSIRLWNVQTALRSPSSECPEGRNSEGLIDILQTDQRLTAVTFDTTGARIIGAGNDGILIVWELGPPDVPFDSPRVRTWLIRGNEVAVFKVAALPRGEVLSGSSDGTVRLWLPDFQDIPQLRHHTSVVRRVKYSPDQSHFFSASESVAAWNNESHRPVAHMNLRDEETVLDLATCRLGDGRTLLAASTKQKAAGRVVLWNVSEPSKPIWRCNLFGDGSESFGFYSVAFSSNGSRLAAGDSEGILHIWEVEGEGTPRLLQKRKVEKEWVSACTFVDPNGNWIVTAGGETPSTPGRTEYAVQLTRLDADVPPLPLGLHTAPVTQIVLDSNGAYLASASEDRTVKLWSVDRASDPPRLRLVHTLEGHDGHNAVAFIPAERRLLAVAQDGTMSVWDFDAAVEVAILRPQQGPLLDLAMSGTGQELLTASSGFHGVGISVGSWDMSVTIELQRFRAAHRRAHEEVLHLLRRKRISFEEARERLRTDPRLPQEVRNIAVTHFEDFLLQATWVLNYQVEQTVNDENSSEQDCWRAYDWARYALRRAPESYKALDYVLKLADRLRYPDVRRAQIVKDAITKLPPGSPMLADFESMAMDE